MVKDSKKEPTRDQYERFKEAARELGCDDSEEAFDEALKKVARHKPKDEKGDKPKRDGK